MMNVIQRENGFFQFDCGFDDEYDAVKNTLTSEKVDMKGQPLSNNKRYL